MTIVPNTFQTPNAFIDQAMPYLTNSELRVLLFATRHIMGWQDKIKKRQGAISLTMFENGFTTADGKRYQGCGLGKHAIITALESLVTFGFLTREGKATEDGQAWELHDTGIKWGELIARTDMNESNRRQQTAKARQKMQEKRYGSASVVEQTGGVSDNTMQGVVEQTSTGVVEHTESKPSSKPSSKPTSRAEKPFPKHYRDWTYEHVERYTARYSLDLVALMAAWGDASVYTSITEMPKSRALQYIETLDELTRIQCKPDDFASLATFTRAALSWKKSISPLDMPSQHGDWLRSRLALPESTTASKPFDLSGWDVSEFNPEELGL
jgi:hypothetical protein